MFRVSKDTELKREDRRDEQRLSSDHFSVIVSTKLHRCALRIGNVLSW